MLLLTFTQVLILSSNRKTLYSGLHIFLQQSSICCMVTVVSLTLQYFCSICSTMPDERPSEMSPSCTNGLIIQRSLVTSSVKYYTSSQMLIFGNKSSFTCNCLVQQMYKAKIFLECYIIVIFFNTKWSFNEC